MKKQIKLLIAAAVVLTPLSSYSSELTFNGFVSAFAGKASGDEKQFMEFECPCFIADFPFVGVYENEWSFDPDTTIGVQANFKVNDDLSATVQLAAHGSMGYDVTAEWAYVSLNANENWTIQAGRKRLPLFYYSDFFDVGYAYTWVRAPSDLYGWQIVGYDGVNALYNSNWGDVSTTINLWTGRDDDNDNQMLSRLYCSYNDNNGGLVVVDVDESWKNMLGGYIDLNYNWLTVRFVHMKNEVTRRTSDSFNCGNKDDLDQSFSGLAVNVDVGNLIVRTEYNTFERPDEENEYTAQLFAIGYRIGEFTPMVTFSEFEEEAGLWEDYVEVHNTKTFTLRWDFSTSVAFKLQYDKFEDESAELLVFTGNSKLISLGFDAVF